MTNDLTGKQILITGATSGIGRAAALALARRGASITIVGRDREKSERVLKELKDESGNARLDLICCDLIRLAEVRRAAEAFKAAHERLDVLVNNAGAMFRRPEPGPDGFERTFALNHLAPFLLTTSLLDLIRATPRARVITTASSMQAFGKLDLERTPTATRGSGVRAYATSKLACILFTRALQRRLVDSGGTAACFCPGSVKTRFGVFGGTDMGPVVNAIFAIGRHFSTTPEEGADTLVWLAASEKAASIQGEFVRNRRVAIPSRQARSLELAEALWALSERLCAEALARGE